MSAFSMVDLKAYQPILTMYIHLALNLDITDMWSNDRDHD